MAKLVWGKEGGAREFELSEGVVQVGRDPANTVCIPDPSVSGLHCELTVEPDRVIVRDLNSTNGTFVDGQRVTESPLEPGQRLRLGNVQLTVAGLLSSSRPAPAAPPPPPPPPPPPGLRVAKPVQTAARAVLPTGGKAVAEAVLSPPDQAWFCETCQQAVNPSEAKAFQSGRLTLYFCPLCGGQCRAPGGMKQEAAAPRQASFFKGILAAFRYPLSEEGLVLLLAGAIFFGALYAARFLAAFAGFLGLIAFFFITIFGTGYLFSFLKSVVSASAQGDREVPKWPDFMEFGSDIVAPFFQAVGIFAFCFGPALAWFIFGPEALKVPVGIGLALLGLTYLPLSVVAVSLYDSLTGLHPLLILNSIARILPHYLVVLGFLGLVLLLRSGALAVAERLPVPLLPFLVAEFLSLYCLIVMMRMLGWMYFVNRRKLGWFK